VIEMWDDRDKKRYKKVCEEGDKNAPLFFGVLKLETFTKNY
jgi:hypothetical protein